MGCGRHRLQLEDSPAHRRVSAQDGARARILKSAYERKVPIFVPAFSDSELGIDFALHKIARQRDKRPLLRFDPFLDFENLPTPCWHQADGIFTIGGGVRAIGRNSSACTRNCWRGAATKNSAEAL